MSAAIRIQCSDGSTPTIALPVVYTWTLQPDGTLIGDIDGGVVWTKV